MVRPVGELERVRRILAFRLRELRRARGLSQEELANRSHCHRTYIGMVERGQGNPSLRILALVSEALSVRLEELLVSQGDTEEGEGLE